MKTTDKFVFFWGNNDIFSNFYYMSFRYKGIVFKWSEQAIMYEKAKLFGADKIADKILKAQTPKACKDLGRSREIPFDNDIWEANRKEIFEDILFHKFRTNAKSEREILSTGDRILVEASPFDKIWGIGMDENHPDAENPSKWKGLNLLGEVLMEVRKKIATDG